MRASRDSARRTSRAAPRLPRPPRRPGSKASRQASANEPGDSRAGRGVPATAASSLPPPSRRGTRPGTRTRTMPPSPRPSPVGRKDSVWESTCCQWPGIAGSSRGSREPSTEATGRANVRVSGARGVTRLPAAGSATTLLRAPGTNHATCAGFGERLPGPNRGRHRRRSRSRAARGADAERHDAPGAFQSLQPSAPDRDPAHRLGEADRHGGTAFRPEQSRADVCRRRDDRDRPLLLLADEPGDPARPADLDRDGQALTGSEPDARPDGAAAQLDRHRRSVGASHRHPLDVPREPGQ